MSYAKFMMMTGRFVDGAEAQRVGLVDLCVPDDRIDAEVAALVRDILANSWHTNRATKQILIETEGMRLADGLSHEHYRYPGLAPDHKERLAAFARKD
jgi:enoyl-CoA hydratase/carnithine racemase